MSTTGDGDLTHGGQEGPTGAVGAQAGARDGVDRNSEPRRGDSMPEAEAGAAVGASGGPREAALEGGNAEEDSDIRPAEEGEVEEQAQGVNRFVVSRHFPMSGFSLTVLNLMHSMMNRLSDNHIILPPNDDRVLVWYQTRPRLSDHSSAAVGGLSEVQVPLDVSGEGPAEEAPDQEVEQAEEAQEAQQAEEAQEAKAPEEASLWETATKESEEPSLREMPQEPVAPEKTAECQDENSKEEAQGTKSAGKEKKYNRKQEEPEKGLDPAKDRPRKSSLED
ncbi:cancer/testis antigen 47A-like [Bos indicus x Bos taurus]|uniref:cancer/testis antigen 47A-like n=1 Tax=Bos indicus x Bos taurus TaxID=30522 RepID=UPI000F7D599B|nr:cancer/testis antigen 47A-like [Bos indicus x Bos taurus]XP_027391288.1 cancer/testis antigen 47A-like [Bos indicus x Bos taurus]